MKLWRCDFCGSQHEISKTPIVVMTDVKHHRLVLQRANDEGLILWQLDICDTCVPHLNEAVKTIPRKRAAEHE